MIEYSKQLQEFVDKWLQELRVQLNYSENTIISYHRDLENFLKFITEHRNEIPDISMLKNLQAIDFRAWFANRRNKDLAARSNVRALSAVKSFFYYLAKFDLLDMKIINSVQRAKLLKLLPKPIPENTLMDFLNLPSYFEKDELWVTNRDRALYTLLYSTGLRINEALNIQTKDVASEIKICGKGKKERIVMLFPITLERIQTYINTCPYDLSDGFLFIGVKGKKLQAPYVDNRLQKLRLMFNLPDHTSAHAFRHSFATHLIKEGADLRSVQELLGHESLSSTQIYTDIDDYSLLEIFQKTHPIEKQQSS